MDNFELIKQFVARFNYEYYRVGISNIKEMLTNQEMNNHWANLKKIIQSRNLKQGEALKLVHEPANQPLDENSDEEAYKWLDLMIYNVERKDGKIDEY